ncbi:MAG: hypothetical protein HZB15_16985 [Actinobacteria bacterium]|nr:hypothetical protein [Actinomycetota bacterium]
MTSRWRPRIAAAAIGWFVVSLGMAALQMDPSPVLLAGIAAVILGGLCLLLDVSDLAGAASWEGFYRPEPLRKGDDVRVRVLQGQLLHGRSLDDGHALHALLVDLIDDRLLAERGVDRAADPQRAAALLGPTLVQFVSAPPSPRRLRDAAFLASIVDHIESL